MRTKDMECIVRSVVTKVWKAYPSVDWDELEGQAWLIVTEYIGNYDKKKGASIKTYLYGQVHGRLQEYTQRTLLKGLNMYGLRVHAEHEAITIDIAPRSEARLTIEKIIKESSGVSRDVLLSMLDGSTQTEVAEELGITRAYVSLILKKVREDYNA